MNWQARDAGFTCTLHALLSAMACITVDQRVRKIDQKAMVNLLYSYLLLLSTIYNTTSTLGVLESRSRVCNFR